MTDLMDLNLAGHIDSETGFAWGQGTYWRVTALSGLFAMTLRTSDVQISGANGSAFGRDWLDEKNVLMTLTATTNDSGVSIMTMVNEFRQTFYRTNGDGSRPVYWDGLGYMMLARVRAGEPQFQPGQQHIVCPVQLTAADGKLYGINAKSMTLSPYGLPTGGGAVPMAVSTTSTAGFAIEQSGGLSQGFAPNLGTESADCVIQINGPCVNPYVQNTTTGGNVKYDGTLGPNDFLIIDTASESISFNGIAARVEDPATVWWNLPPNSNSNLRFGADSYGAQASCVIQWRDTWG